MLIYAPLTYENTVDPSVSNDIIVTAHILPWVLHVCMN